MTYYDAWWFGLPYSLPYLDGLYMIPYSLPYIYILLMMVHHILIHRAYQLACRWPAPGGHLRWKLKVVPRGGKAARGW
jgi:hypothetical protein